MVHVVIKAANGAVDDFRVNCATPQWTVAQLKNYLYRHYPTHPVSVGNVRTQTLHVNVPRCVSVLVYAGLIYLYVYVGLAWPCCNGWLIDSIHTLCIPM